MTGELASAFGSLRRGERPRLCRAVHYPVACHPQAFAAGAIPFMLESALGLMPDGFNRTLRISSPVLPATITKLSIDRLRVGTASARIDFARSPHGDISVHDVALTGNLEIIVE